METGPIKSNLIIRGYYRFFDEHHFLLLEDEIGRTQHLQLGKIMTKQETKMTQDVYQLPQSLAAAMATNRKELVEIFANSEAQTELERTMARLIGDLIEDRHILIQETTQAKEALHQVIKQMESAQRKIEMASRAAQGIRDEP
jgi:cell division FtsZ-interacting protein ZapD